MAQNQKKEKKKKEKILRNLRDTAPSANTPCLSPTFGICQQSDVFYRNPAGSSTGGGESTGGNTILSYSSSLQRYFLLSCQGTAIEIKEVRYFPKYFGTEYVEDFGYSHGPQLAYLYPGKSNAIDGYLVYEVPVPLSAEKAYVEIVFNGKTTGVGKLG